MPRAWTSHPLPKKGVTITVDPQEVQDVASQITLADYLDKVDAFVLQSADREEGETTDAS